MAKRYRVQEPVAPYVADEDRVEAKLFANGRSQAIRLPKQFRMPGDRVLIHREGKRLIVEPMEDPELDDRGWPLDFWQRIDALLEETTDKEWSAFYGATSNDPVPPPIEEEMGDGSKAADDGEAPPA